MGSPAMGARAAKAAIAPPGTPGVPILSKVLAARTVIMVSSVRGMPKAAAKKLIIKDIRILTASMLMVAPRGSVKEAISSGTSKDSTAHSIERGRVALEEQVENAFKLAGAMELKNLPTGIFPTRRTIPPYTIRA